MQPETHQFSAKRGNRPVWVLNNGTHTYKEVFRGEEISVPPNRQKVLKMPYLAARRFLGQVSVAQEAAQLPNGQLPDGFVPKALEVIELTNKELKELGMSKSDLETAAKKQDEDARHTCTVCGDRMANEHGLKIHVRKMHPDAMPAKDE